MWTAEGESRLGASRPFCASFNAPLHYHEPLPRPEACTVMGLDKRRNIKWHGAALFITNGLLPEEEKTKTKHTRAFRGFSFATETRRWKQLKWRFFLNKDWSRLHVHLLECTSWVCVLYLFFWMTFTPLLFKARGSFHATTRLLICRLYIRHNFCLFLFIELVSKAVALEMYR